MTREQLVAVFVVGSLFGAAVAWQVSKYLERFRRARLDFRRARRGMRTLVEMLVRRGFEAAGWALVGVVVVGGLVWLAASRGTR